ncbi:DUF1566 domain-containing protein [bacterium]|nr:DUF1566 domain-containing protein [bacterium]
MKFKSLILLVVSVFVLFSCDDGIKFDNPYDINSDAYNPSDTDTQTNDDDSDKTDTMSEYDDEKTDTVSTNDDDEPVSDDSDSDSTPDDADSIDDSGNSELDENNSDDDSDSAPENDDDSTDIEPDESDSTPDEDTDTDSGDSTPDEDADEPDEEPTTRTATCSGITNSTGSCAVSGTSYSCGCNSGYFWNDGKCKRITLGNICTGQTRCYNESEEIPCPTSKTADFYGQDAQYTSRCTAQSFTLGTGSQAGTVIDNKTGLIWEQSPSENTYSWEDAPNHCTELNSSNYGGKSNWRVPNPLELLTIVDGNKYGPATNSNFTNIPIGRDDFLWTSKDYGASLARAFRSYYGVYLYGESKTKTYKVLCVSGNQLVAATSSDFTIQNINDEVVVKDATTGLMWQKGYATGKKTWQQALKHCEDLTYAGYSDWRLPNKNELASLLDPGKYGAPYSNFPDMPSNYFWSSSTASSDIDLAWRMDVIYGYVWYSDKSNTESVRCVRNAD